MARLKQGNVIVNVADDKAERLIATGMFKAAPAAKPKAEPKAAPAAKPKAEPKAAPAASQGD